MYKSFQIIGFVAAGAFLQGCGQQETDQSSTESVDAAPVSVEAVVGGRAEDRWQALAEWDFDKAYEYLSPGVRSVMSLADYRKERASGPAEVKKAVVKSTRCEEQVCTLQLELSYIYSGSIATMRGQELTSGVTEKWIESDQAWYYVPN